MLSVPTPTVKGRVDMQYIKKAAEHLGRRLPQLGKYPVAVVRSTVLPGTMEDLLLPILEKESGMRAGDEEFGVVSNPEFLRQRCAAEDFLSPRLTVLGGSGRALDIMEDLYSPYGSVIVRCLPKEAEMIKYASNNFNSVKISYFNELAGICENMGVDANIISAAVSTSAEGMWNARYGTYGRAPFGGECLPKDIKGFISFCRDKKFLHSILEAALRTNEDLENELKGKKRRS